VKNKISSFVLFALLFGVSGTAQVGIGTTAPDANAILDVSSSSQGFLPPRMTNSQISAIASPVAGLTVFCTDCDCGAGAIYAYAGGGWHSVGITPIFLTSCGSTQTYYHVCAAGYTWLDRNLGASRVAQSSTDYQAYGSLYEWGRQSDSHQCITWTATNAGTPVNGTTTTQCSGGTCVNALFVVTYINWNNSDLPLLWTYPKAANDPCPSGYRVPWHTELQALDNSFSPNNMTGAFASPVKMPVSGYRNYNNGVLDYMSSRGFYWSSSFNGSTDAQYLYFTSDLSTMTSNQRAFGFSVRCIAQ
jgi:uncharacterized protein (TIGR02145 family)